MLEFHAPPRMETGELGREAAPSGGRKGIPAPVTQTEGRGHTPPMNADTVFSVRAEGRLVQRLRR